MPRSVKTDLTGKQFGEWTVEKYLGNSLWECKCSCGKIKAIKTGKLTCGQTMSCGHNKIIDLTGKQFGEWTVLEYTGNMLWKCQCSCGVIKELNGRYLREGNSTSCGHTYLGNRIDLTGQVFGEYKVLRYAGDKYWECQCSCGKIKIIHGYRLRSGETKSCGHINKLKDLIGEKFGKLTPIKYLGNRNYLCSCECGKTKVVASYNLINGSTSSCGCVKSTIYTKDYILSKLDEYKEQFNDKPFKDEFATYLGISYEYIIKLINDYDIPNYLFNQTYGSKPEKEIVDAIKNIDDKILIEMHDRSILGNRELDIYIPDKKLAIEFNGTYWHNSDIRHREYHQDKTLDCLKHGVQLIHIFEYEWSIPDTRNKILNLLRYYIVGSKKIYARSCKLITVDIKTEQEFLDKYHLQKYTSSRIAYGLVHNDELVSIMTFGVPRFNNKYEYELIRYCSKPDISIVGGAEKLFSAFVNNMNPTSVVSYCDLSKFTGAIYEKLGMKSDNDCITTPNYRWAKNRIINGEEDVLTRYQTQITKLIEKGLGDFGKTEDEIMRGLNYYKIYDCGNVRFTWSNI